jgi:integrase
LARGFGLAEQQVDHGQAVHVHDPAAQEVTRPLLDRLLDPVPGVGGVAVAGTVAVYRSVRAKGETKTRRSRRVLQLPERVVAALRAHHRRQTAERLQAGDAWQDHGLVFCRQDGTALDRWQVRRELGQIAKAAGLGERWTPRELGHSFVSILSASDVPLEAISQLVGHVSTGITETVYRHGIRPALTKGAAAMDEIFKRAPESA